MNALMASIRRGIEAGDLEAVERAYVHPRLVDSLRDEGSEGIGS